MPVIRRAEPADAARLGAVSVRLFRQAFASANTAEDVDLHERRSFNEEVQRSDLMNENRAAFLVEAAAGDVVGYALLARGTRDDAVPAAQPAEVQRFYIDQSWHGRGLAQRLMRACLKQCSVWRCDIVWLGVWENNPRAIAFYERQGFRRVGSKTFLLGRDLQHDFVMMRTVA